MGKKGQPLIGSSNQRRNTPEPAMPYTISGQIFGTKADVTKRCRDILSATPNGALVDMNGCAFLMDLFSHHTEWAQKHGPGISAITTMTTDHGTRCFRLHRVDGEIVDISFTHAIKHLPTTRSKSLMPQPLIDFKNGARMAIKDQIEAFRSAQPELCAGATHVDHVYPRTFDALLMGFCLECSVNPLAVEVIELNQCIHHIIDDGIRTAWQAYHHQHARLALVTQAANLSAPKTKVDWARTWTRVDSVESTRAIDAATRTCPGCGSVFQVDDHDDPQGAMTWSQWEGPCCVAKLEQATK